MADIGETGLKLEDLVQGYIEDPASGDELAGLGGKWTETGYETQPDKQSHR